MTLWHELCDIIIIFSYIVVEKSIEVTLKKKKKIESIYELIQNHRRNR